MAEKCGDGASEGGAVAEQDEKVKAENGGRKDKRQSNECFGEDVQARTAERDPRGDRDGNAEQDRGGDCGEFEGEDECLPIHAGLSVLQASR